MLIQNGTPYIEIKELKTEADWLKINGRNMLDVDFTGYSLEDLPPAKTFKKAKIDYRATVYGYLRFMLQNAPKKKRKADNEEEKAKRQRVALAMAAAESANSS